MCGFFRCLVKYLLFTFNLILVLLGVAIIVLGIIFHYQLDQLKDYLPEEIGDIGDYINFLPIIFIVVGCVLVIVSFPGCCGSITESKCLLIMYVCFMVILAGIKIFIVVTLSKNLGDYRNEVERLVNDAFVNPNQNVTFHALEHFLQCCGTHGPDSYEEQEYLPPTCCEGVAEACINEGEENILNCLCEKDNAYEVGCSSLLGDYFEFIGKKFGDVIIVIIVVELVTMASATYLSCTVRSKR